MDWWRIRMLLLATLAHGCVGQITSEEVDAGSDDATDDSPSPGPDSPVDSSAERGCLGPADCDDGIECTTDVCDLARGACEHRAPDEDGDGHAAADCLDAAGQPLGDDCDDTRLSRNPGQAEFCNGVDDDCDSLIDEDATAIDWYADEDLDGFGGGVVVGTSCLPVAGASVTSTDCDDADRTVNPAAAEGCTGRDDDCDGSIDEGDVCRIDPPDDGGMPDPCAGEPLNDCGGCGDLARARGTICGPCGFDVYICDGTEATVCGGQTYGNACDGCDELANAFGAACGRCDLDEYICQGVDTVCDGDSAGNACGGCAALAAEPGAACGPCGLDGYICAAGDFDAVVCDGESVGNACGGCDTLQDTPGSTCGKCDLDVYECAGGQAVCSGDTRGNACGGCGTLNNQPGEACGQCDLDSYVCDGVDADSVSCGGNTAANACGGCGVLAGQPGAACGRCGRDAYECLAGDVVCDGDTAINGCGGCDPLPMLGYGCGDCGLDSYVCDSSDPESVVCSGQTPGNACGGCGDLADPPLTVCGPCDLDEFICVTLEATACDGRTYGGSCQPPVEVPDEPYFDPVADWDYAWTAFEEEVLVLVNQHRAAGADCGSEGIFTAVPPLVMDPRLRGAARLHSLDMYERQFFAHTNPDGLGPPERMEDAGYNWTAYGENIAWGSTAPAEVMAGWMDSDGHCANIMAPFFTEIGIGYHRGGGGYPHLWTQVFGRP